MELLLFLVAVVVCLNALAKGLRRAGTKVHLPPGSVVFIPDQPSVHHGSDTDLPAETTWRRIKALKDQTKEG